MGPKAVFLEPLPYDQKADIDFEQACFFQRGGDAAPPLGTIFCPIDWEALFSDPLPYYLVADIGFEQTRFFTKGVGARSHWGTIFAPWVQKLFFWNPCLMTRKPTSVLNRPASSKRGAMQHPLWEPFWPYRFESSFFGPPALLLGGRHRLNKDPKPGPKMGSKKPWGGNPAWGR